MQKGILDKLDCARKSLLLLFQAVSQGPLKKWTEHSQELHLLKLHSREGSYYTPGLDGGSFFGP